MAGFNLMVLLGLVTLNKTQIQLLFGYGKNWGLTFSCLFHNYKNSKNVQFEIR